MQLVEIPSIGKTRQHNAKPTHQRQTNDKQIAQRHTDLVGIVGHPINERTALHGGKGRTTLCESTSSQGHDKIMNRNDIAIKDNEQQQRLRWVLLRAQRFVNLIM